jgi:two-component system sensor histidine kinase/response regulator
MSSGKELQKSALAARRAIDALCAQLDAQLDAPGSVLPDASSVQELASAAAGLLSRLGSGAAVPPQASDQAARVYFDYALTGILETDRDWRVLRANPAAASITGRDVKVLCGSRLQALANEVSAARLERHLSLLREQGISRAELRVVRSDGREIVIELASIQVDDDHYGHVFDDVTEQRQATAEIERARIAAEEANRAKSDFLANVSHELRTPMNGIIGLSQLLLLTGLDAQQRDFVGKIARSGQNLLRIINDLLDAARLESGRMEFEHEPFFLAELLDELAGIRSQIPAGAPLELGFHVAPAVPPCLLGDRLRLGQCLTNLLGNAIKFTAAGRVDLHVDVAGYPDAPTLRFCVVDTGIGIAADALARLFAPFSQADAATARRYGGSGLGLHISRELARGMGGDLQAESSVGSGSRFTLTLPLQAADAAAAKMPAIAAAASDVPQEFRGRRILVAEDDRVNQLVITQWLARAGIATTVAHNGQEVLEQIAAAAPDLVLMDVQMPGMDGLEATRRLRELGIELPVIGLSAGVSRSEQDACAAAGMHDFIAKPIDVDELWGCLTRWLHPVEGSAAMPGEDSVEARFLNDGAALARARTVFLEDHGDDAARLRALCTGGDTAATGRLAHGLKGAAATLGLDELAAMAGDLEAGAGGPQRTGVLIDAIDRLLAAFKGEFQDR